MGLPLLLGELPINGRRPRKEEFNPFAKDASQQHRRRREDRERKAARRPAPVNETTPSQPADIQADLERKQREAMKKLEQKVMFLLPFAPAPLPAEVPRAKEQSKPASVTREDRLAELRRKSEELKANAPSTEAHTEPSVQPETDAVEADVEELVVEFDSDDDTVALPEKAQKRVQKCLQKSKPKLHQSKTGVAVAESTKKGGGTAKARKETQPTKVFGVQMHARDILDNPNVPEEHRSNVLGQIWAKGERQGIDDSLEFIEQKEAELILPAEVAEEFAHSSNV